MKKLFCAVAASVCLIGAGSAMAGDRHHHKGGEWKGKSGSHLLEKKLDLTDEQKEQIQAIYQARKESAREGHGERGSRGLMALDPQAADYHEQVQTLAKESAHKLEQRIIARGNTHAEIYAVLTPEQQEELKALQQKKHERHQLRANQKSQTSGD